MNRLLSILALSLIFYGCSPTGKTTKATESDQKNGNVVEVNNNTITLADYLRRVPGVLVQGSGDNVTLTIRGVQSVNSDNSPLFIIDGQRVGNNYANANRLVDINDIDSVEVLKGSEGGARYGIVGSNGVIIIRTKRS